MAGPSQVASDFSVGMPWSHGSSNSVDKKIKRDVAGGQAIWIVSGLQGLVKSAFGLSGVPMVVSTSPRPLVAHLPPTEKGRRRLKNRWQVHRA